MAAAGALESLKASSAHTRGVGQFPLHLSVTGASVQCRERCGRNYMGTCFQSWHCHGSTHGWLYLGLRGQTSDLLVLKSIALHSSLHLTPLPSASQHLSPIVQGIQWATVRLWGKLGSQIAASKASSVECLWVPEM
jgi:hypothetical protein